MPPDQKGLNSGNLNVTYYLDLDLDTDRSRPLFLLDSRSVQILFPVRQPMSYFV